MSEAPEVLDQAYNAALKIPASQQKLNLLRAGRIASRRRDKGLPFNENLLDAAHELSAEILPAAPQSKLLVSGG